MYWSQSSQDPSLTWRDIQPEWLDAEQLEDQEVGPPYETGQASKGGRKKGADDEKMLKFPLQWSQITACGTKESAMQGQTGPNK